MNLMSRPALVRRKSVRTTADSAAARPKHDRNGALLTHQRFHRKRYVISPLFNYLAHAGGIRHSRNVRYGILDRDRADHSALMLAARITLPHFSVSSAMS